MTTPEGLLAGMAEGLRRRVAERAQAEARLADFVFREGSDDPDVRSQVEPGDWRYFVSRTLSAAGEPGTLELLERLSGGDETLLTLARDHPAGLAGGLATIDRVGGLAAAGLAGRDLETGRVRLTGLGSALLALVLDLERRAAEPARADEQAPR